MQLHIADTNELTNLDRQVLSALLGGTPASPAPAPAKAAPKVEKAAPAQKAAPEPEPVSTPEPEKEDEDLLGGGDETVTREDAVNIATKLVSSGKQAQVKEALASVGVKRVSEIPDEKLAEFVNSLK